MILNALFVVTTRLTDRTTTGLARRRVLGDHYVDAIEREDIVAWRNARRGTPATINTRLRVLRTVLADATEELRLARNPSARVKATDEQVHDAPPNRLTAEQLPRVLAALKEHEPERYPLFLTLALTAARVCEATALKWSDIDFDASSIHIRSARWKEHIGTTKTGRTRTVPMLEPLAAELRTHRRNLMERQAKGFEAGWVFPSASGSPIRGPTLWKPLKRALVVVGVTERFTLHGLRRTFNNLAWQVASGEVVRAMTGHATARMTEHYSHIESEEKRRAADAVLRLVYPAADRSGLGGGTPLAEPNEKTS
jgi:integrase